MSLFILTMHKFCKVNGRFVNVITLQVSLKHLSSICLNNSLAVNLCPFLPDCGSCNSLRTRFLKKKKKNFAFATVLISLHAI